MNVTGSGAVRPGKILVVCDRNVCASPYLERLLISQLADTEIEISSAGTVAMDGGPMHPSVVERLRAAGGDPAGFRARQLTAEMVRDADLVLCATRRQRGQVVLMEPHGLHYTFAALDFADLVVRLSSVQPRHEPAGTMDMDASVVSQVVEAAIEHRPDVHARLKGDADILDPYGRRKRHFATMAKQLDAAAAPIVRAMRSAVGYDTLRSDRGFTSV